MFVEIKDLYINKDSIIGMGKSTVAATYSNPECYTLSIYIVSSTNPIIVVYETEEQRDADYSTLKGVL